MVRITTLSLLALAAGCGGAGSSDDSGGGSPAHGSVLIVPYYEAGSAWESNLAARDMVDALFAEITATLRTSGAWDATIEVYLTDDNPGYANTYFDETFAPVTLDGKALSAVPAWRKIVLGEEDHNGPADTAGNGYDFAIAFNVQQNADNAGLLRHEAMHGFGAVNAIPNPVMSPANELSGLVEGARVAASVYDLALFDRNGAPLLGDYDSSTQMFQVAAFDIDGTHSEWTDGDAGFFFRGVSDAGGDLDMLLGTQPYGEDALLALNEPQTLMSAGAHPSWNHIEEPDRAFFRALRYELAE